MFCLSLRTKTETGRSKNNNASRQIEGYKGFLLLTVGSQLKATHEVHAKKKTESN